MGVLGDNFIMLPRSALIIEKILVISRIRPIAICSSPHVFDPNAIAHRDAAVSRRSAVWRFYAVFNAHSALGPIGRNLANSGSPLPSAQPPALSLIVIDIERSRVIAASYLTGA